MKFNKRFWSFTLVCVLLSAIGFIGWGASVALKAEENLHLTFAVCEALTVFIETHSGKFPADRAELLAHNQEYRPTTMNGPDLRSLDRARLIKAEMGLSIPYGQSVCDTDLNSYDLLRPSFKYQFVTRPDDWAFHEFNKAIEKWRAKCPPLVSQ